MRLLWLGCLMTMLGPGNGDGGTERAVATAREFLAPRLKVEPQALTLVEVSAVEWPDRSLGCPEKGMVYAQVVTAGHRVTLRSSDESYEVHVAGDLAVRCAETAPAKPGLVAAGARAYALCRRDLASRLGIAQKDITGSWKVVADSDATSACPGANPGSEAGKQSRFAVKLEAGGKTYRYGADAEHAVACAEPHP
jgi:hypothetical protein